MSIQMPPTLLVLTAKRLLRDQASAITALEYLPAELFPDLFVLVYRSGHHCQLLKAMAQAWPFTVLPLGALMQHPPDHAPTSAMGLKAVFDALDVLFAQEIRPRRCKLRVLDLRNTGANFWNTWCRDNAWHCSLTGPVTVHSSSPNMEHPLDPLEVFLDLNFNERDRDEFSMHIIQWAQKRERLLHLCCKAVRISGVPFQRVRRVLDRVQLDCIQEVEVKCTWDLPTLGTFALYLGQMSNLQRLSLPHIKLLAEEDEDEEQEEEGEEEEQQEEEQEWEEEEELEMEEQEQEEEEQEWEEEGELKMEEQEQEEEEQEWEEEGELEREEQEWEEEEELKMEEQEQEEEEQEWEEEGELEREEQEREEEEQEWEDEGELEREEAEEQEVERQEQEEQRSFSQFLSQMLRLRHLRELDMRSPSFLQGRLDQMLRCLQTPLDKLSITHCQRLTHSDLTHLFQCPNLRQLKILDLFGIRLADFSPEPLRALLEAVAPTLQDLGLDNCGLADSQVEAILPALSRCHQLSFFTVSINNFPVATVEKLLRHTTGLRSLELELYPVSLECYRTWGTVDQERVALIQAELTGILRELGQPRRILLATKHFRHREFYHVEFS